MRRCDPTETTLAGGAARGRAPGGDAAGAGSRSSSAPRPASARPTRCCRPRRAKRQDGVDVVVGVVETHGRTETQALLDGLEVIPRRRGRTTRAACSRRWTSTPCWRAARSSCSSTSSPTPTRPGSRHPKRYLDVEELLDAGIDVYTTLNIQHVESLNDVVAQITRIRVRETVPDSILDRADDIELIDLTPDDLIQRLQGRQGLCSRAGASARSSTTSRPAT